MEWIIRFIAVWIIFFILVDWKQLKTNIWCGLFSILLQLSIDTFNLQDKLYEVRNPIISIWGSSAFFIFGPTFVVAVLISQFHPSKRWAAIINVLAFTVIYTLEELLLVLRNALVYLNWSLLQSFVINAVIMMSLSWFSVIVLKRGVNKA